MVQCTLSAHGYTSPKGGKGEVTEGGVGVPAMAYWPGMIKLIKIEYSSIMISIQQQQNIA